MSVQPSLAANSDDGCAVAVGRITYLERRAAFHENATKEIRAKIERDFVLSKQRQEAWEREQNIYICGVAVYGHGDDWRSICLHEYLTKQYRQALYRPWTTVNESPSLEELYGDP